MKNLSNPVADAETHSDDPVIPQGFVRIMRAPCGHVHPCWHGSCDEEDPEEVVVPIDSGLVFTIPHTTF